MKFISLFVCIYVPLFNRSTDSVLALILWEKHPVKLK